MRFFTVLAVLAGVVTALPQPATEPEPPADAALVSLLMPIYVCAK
jgi:hypothetical protein